MCKWILVLLHSRLFVRRFSRKGWLLTRRQQEFDFGDHVELATFEQILDMDEGEDEEGHEFSHSIVFGYFEQAESTFQKMDAAVYGINSPLIWDITDSGTEKRKILQSFQV